MSPRAKQVTAVNRRLFDELGAHVVPLPPVFWFIRGPRGGIYEASSDRYREVERTNMTTADWMSGRDVVYIIDSSASVRYLRPGTKRHSFALSELAGGATE